MRPPPAFRWRGQPPSEDPTGLNTTRHSRAASSTRYRLKKCSSRRIAAWGGWRWTSGFRIGPSMQDADPDVDHGRVCMRRCNTLKCRSARAGRSTAPAPRPCRHRQSSSRVTHEFPRIPGQGSCLPSTASRCRRARLPSSPDQAVDAAKAICGEPGWSRHRSTRAAAARPAASSSARPGRGARHAKGMLGTKMVTYQTGGVACRSPGAGHPGHRHRQGAVPVGAGRPRHPGTITFIASAEGGVEIEKVAKSKPRQDQDPERRFRRRACSRTSAASMASRWASTPSRSAS
jgi:hypothetical protein